MFFVSHLKFCSRAQGLDSIMVKLPRYSHISQELCPRFADSLVICSMQSRDGSRVKTTGSEQDSK